LSELLQFSAEEEILTVVHKFEACEYLPNQFTHAHHLAVSAWYLEHNSRPEALSRMRASLLRFTGHHQVKAYHETITRFWMEMVGDSLARKCDLSFTARVNQLISRHTSKNEIYVYYTRERLQSDEARSGWILPDLRPLDFFSDDLEPRAVTSVSPDRS
jgi:hypothetical protein